MYIEQKTGQSQAWIGRVRFSRTGRTMYYRDLVLVKAEGGGVYGNCYGYPREDWKAWVNQSISEGEEYWASGAVPRRGRRGRRLHLPVRGEEYWVSGPKEGGSDRLFGGRTPVIHIDEDVREEYWLRIRNRPERVNDKTC
jgi:hypothetical protein